MTLAGNDKDIGVRRSSGIKYDGEILDVRKLSQIKQEEKIYPYDNALEMAGSGKYNLRLLVTMCIATHAMTLDVFGFSVIVNGAVCDLKLEQYQKSLLLTIPLLGSITMAYPWGYLSDTKGRRKCLIIAISVSYTAAVLGAFSPSWIVLAVFKFIGSACSSGIQSMTYTLLGESCPRRCKNAYMLILSSFLVSAVSMYMVESYLVFKAHFSVDLGLIVFTPWRLLALILSLPMAVALISLTWCYESPKYLLNSGQHDEALDVLKKIHATNKGSDVSYPEKNGLMNEVFQLPVQVSRITMNEMCSLVSGSSLLRSLMEQTVPLFKPPLLKNTLLLYYLTIVVYISNNGFYGWLPFYMEAFSKSLTSNSYFNETRALCAMIASSESFQDAPVEMCTSIVELTTVWAFMIQGVVFTSCGLMIAIVADRRKLLLISILLFSTVCASISVSLPERISSIIFFFAILMTSLTIGPLFSYIVDLYPTSYRWG
ncbi:synaptic vesicle glycoprotein 2C-like [Battus philenor]|uniref:synaptic vesicle glycoprotein 2C-like n=1 Tax=Battus philenor TaxID=42288 RepID=UPI0035CF3EA0